ncbi:MAG: amidohydrolase family protein [Hyphomicrobiaceae bacterium]
MIIDMHCHFIPSDYFAFVKSRPEMEVVDIAHNGEAVDVAVRGVKFALNETFFDPGRQIARMDRLGIGRTVVSLATPLINYFTDPSLATEAAKICNDGFARLVASAPSRFAAWAFLPMQDPAAAAAELRRCVTEHGFVGGHIASNVRGAYLPDEHFAPIMEAAQGLDVPLFVHPADPAGKDRTADFELTVIAGYMFDSTINIFRMICSGFLDRYPRLKLVCAHTGGYSLMLRGRMQCEVNTNPAIARALKQPVGAYLDRLYYDTAGFEPGYLGFAATVIPPERLLFGTDAPFLLVLDDPIGFVREGLPAAAAEAALGANFQRLAG